MAVKELDPRVAAVLAELEQVDPAAAEAARRTLTDDSRVKGRRFNMRLSQTQYDQLHNDARAAGYSAVSTYVVERLELGD